MKHLLLAVLLFAPLAQADTILAGNMKAPGEQVTYYFDVQQFVTATYVEDVLNGQLVYKNGSVGCHPCTTNYLDEMYLFGFTDTVTLEQFNFNGSNWTLLASLGSVRLVDPPAATPEPAVWFMLVCGLCWIVIVLWPRRSGFGRR